MKLTCLAGMMTHQGSNASKIATVHLCTHHKSIRSAAAQEQGSEKKQLPMTNLFPKASPDRKQSGVKLLKGRWRTDAPSLLHILILLF